MRPGVSCIPNSGEGLFALCALPRGSLVSFYNGTRPLAAAVDRRPWSLNGNAITVVDEEATCIDVPEPWDVTARYCASLSHKANHTFRRSGPSAGFELLVHPRFGKLKAMRLLRDVAEGEEIMVDYGYPRTGRSGPDWFKQGVRDLRDGKDAAGGEVPVLSSVASAAGADSAGSDSVLQEPDAEEGADASVDLRAVPWATLPAAARAALRAFGVAGAGPAAAAAVSK